MKIFPILLLGLFAQGDLEMGDPQPVTPISFGGGEFTRAFNVADDRPRVVIVFSPT